MKTDTWKPIGTIARSLAAKLSAAREEILRTSGAGIAANDVNEGGVAAGGVVSSDAGIAAAGELAGNANVMKVARDAPDRASAGLGIVPTLAGSAVFTFARAWGARTGEAQLPLSQRVSPVFHDTIPAPTAAWI